MHDFVLTYDILLGFEDAIQNGTVNIDVEDEFKSILWARIANECLLGAEVLWRQELRVETYFESILQHVWNESGQQRARQLKAWIRVDFDEVGAELVVDHEVEAEHLHGVKSTLRIKLVIACSEYISGHFVHLRLDISLEANV